MGVIYRKDLEPDTFTMEDLPPLNLSSKNGFFKLWSLNEPMDVDVRDPEVIAKYQKLLDPSRTNEESLKHWVKNKYRKRKWRHHFDEIDKALSFIVKSDYQDECIKHLEKKKDQILSFVNSHNIWIQRYESFIRSPVIEDMTNPKIEVYPNLLMIIKMSQVYSAFQLLNAFNGEWERSVYGLIDQFQAARKLSSNGRESIIQMITRKVIHYSLKSLWVIANHPECPQKIYKIILEKVSSPIEYKELMPNTALIGDYISTMKDIKNEIYSDLEQSPIMKLIVNIFIDFKGSNQLIFNQHKKIINFKGDIPYYKAEPQFRYRPIFEKDYSLRCFFILIFNNGAGKHFLDLSSSNFIHTLRSLYRTKVYQDRLILLSELRLKYNMEQKIDNPIDILTYKRKRDPFSGKPYKWDKKKQIFYSQYLREEEEKKVIERLKEEEENKREKTSPKRRRRRR